MKMSPQFLFKYRSHRFIVFKINKQDLFLLGPAQEHSAREPVGPSSQRLRDGVRPRPSRFYSSGGRADSLIKLGGGGGEIPRQGTHMEGATWNGRRYSA